MQRIIDILYSAYYKIILCIKRLHHNNIGLMLCKQYSLPHHIAQHKPTRFKRIRCPETKTRYQIRKLVAPNRDKHWYIPKQGSQQRARLELGGELTADHRLLRQTRCSVVRMGKHTTQTSCDIRLHIVIVRLLVVYTNMWANSRPHSRVMIITD